MRMALAHNLKSRMFFSLLSAFSSSFVGLHTQATIERRCWPSGSAVPHTLSALSPSQPPRPSVAQYQHCHCPIRILIHPDSPILDAAASKNPSQACLRLNFLSLQLPVAPSPPSTHPPSLPPSSLYFFFLPPAASFSFFSSLSILHLLYSSTSNSNPLTVGFLHLPTSSPRAVALLLRGIKACYLLVFLTHPITVKRFFFFHPLTAALAAK